MKKTAVLFTAMVFTFAFAFSQGRNTRVFTMFTSAGCGCTGSGGAPQNFTTHEEVLARLGQSCEGIEFVNWKGSYPDACQEVDNNKAGYDGVLIIGRISGDYRLAFTGLPTIVVYNLFEFMDAQPYNLFITGDTDEEGNVLKGGTDYPHPKILTAQLDRRNLSAPEAREAMFSDLVYKIKLIRAVKELKETRILMVKNSKNEIIAGVNYRGDVGQAFPPDHNERYINNLRELFGIEFVMVEPEEFYETYKKIDVGKVEETADKWIRNARKVEASRTEILKTTRGYLALDELRVKYNCTAVSTHIRTVTGSGELKDLYNPGVGLELGFKTRGIQAVCQNYPDILLGQIMAYLITGRPSMLGDYIYDIFNSTEIILHCGIPVNPWGGERRIPYTIRTHAESPVRDHPEEPGSSTGLTAEWPVGEAVTFWDVHSLNRAITLHTGTIVDSKAVYNGGEDLDQVMCTGKIVAKVENLEKVQEHFKPYLYGIHYNATLGDLRQQIRDMGVFLGMEVIETDR
jgi:hypothetical protein